MFFFFALFFVFILSAPEDFKWNSPKLSFIRLSDSVHDLVYGRNLFGAFHCEKSGAGLEYGVTLQGGVVFFLHSAKIATSGAELCTMKWLQGWSRFDSIFI